MKVIPTFKLNPNPLPALDRVAEVQFELPQLREYLDSCQRLYSDSIGLIGKVVKCIRHASGGYTVASLAQIDKADRERGTCPFRVINRVVFFDGELPVFVAEHADGQSIDIQDGRPCGLGIVDTERRIAAMEQLDREEIMRQHYEAIREAEARKLAARRSREISEARQELAYYERNADRLAANNWPVANMIERARRAIG